MALILLAVQAELEGNLHCELGTLSATKKVQKLDYYICFRYSNAFYKPI